MTGKKKAVVIINGNPRVGNSTYTIGTYIFLKGINNVCFSLKQWILLPYLLNEKGINIYLTNGIR